MLNMNSVFFGSRKFNKSNSEEASTNPKTHTAAKILTGTVALAGVSVAGLALGYKTGVFSKGSTKLFDKIVAMASGLEDITKPPKAVKIKANAFKVGFKVFDKMSNAGAYICQFATEKFNLAKKFVKRKIS